ncbi:glutamate-1-semialdehyde 2,1-aminomutase [Myxococcota bacterium]|nr:glutamate-1-semialdehyde 2,1-aminomutase [Myxococcota bacterium]
MATRTEATPEVGTAADLADRAARSIPGGVNSPVRAFRSVGLPPVFAESARGSQVHASGGRTYIDYIGSWGPMILGHAHPEIVEAVVRAAERGTSFGLATQEEVLFAEEIRAAVPSMDRVRLVSSGTEATMSAIRLARAATGRDVVVKFDGCYHGHADGLLVAAGSGAATFGVPDSPGVPRAYAACTAVAPFNDLPALARLFEARGEEIAAVIVEPVAGNMGCVPPGEGFLHGLRDLCRSTGALLILDEVMTGFRLAYGGAQELYGLTPDLTCLGKIVGGGLPLAAYGGRADLMDRVSPAGPVYQAGTLSGNPLAVAAGRAMLRLLREEGVYARLEEASAFLEAALLAEIPADVPARLQRVGSMLTLFFRREPVVDFATARASDLGAFRAFYGAMLDQGILLPPSQFEAWFVSLAHSHDDLSRTAQAAGRALARLPRDG